MLELGIGKISQDIYYIHIFVPRLLTHQIFVLDDFPIYSASSRLTAGRLGSVVFFRSLFRAGSGESSKSTTSTSPEIGIHHREIIKGLMLYIYKMLSQRLWL